MYKTRSAQLATVCLLVYTFVQSNNNRWKNNSNIRNNNNNSNNNKNNSKKNNNTRNEMSIVNGDGRKLWL